MVRQERTINSKDLLVAWLNDAHAMEQGLVPVLENHAKDAREHPEIEGRIRQHVQETRRHAELVRGCLERLGEKPSKTKAALAKVFGNFQAPTTGMFTDENVKNGLSDYAVENFEIAAYSALIHAAEQMGEPEIASTCEEIRREEEQMAEWLQQQLPRIVEEALATA